MALTEKISIEQSFINNIFSIQSTSSKLILYKPKYFFWLRKKQLIDNIKNYQPLCDIILLDFIIQLWIDKIFITCSKHINHDKLLDMVVDVVNNEKSINSNRTWKILSKGILKINPTIKKIYKPLDDIAINNILSLLGNDPLSNCLRYYMNRVECELILLTYSNKDRIGI